MGGFHTITLGCKLNQFDGAAIEGELARRGFAHQPSPALAKVVIINTCTVTHRADADARKHVRRIRRVNPHCRLLVTGCYAELDAAALRQMDGIDRVFGNRQKQHLPQILDELGLVAAPSLHETSATSNSALTELGQPTDRGCDGAPQDEQDEQDELNELGQQNHLGQQNKRGQERKDFPSSLRLPGQIHLAHRSRAFLKIQDGCRLACSYCIIPTVRGPSRSVPPEQVEHALQRLLDTGYREVVLTGVNTGDYGRDLDPSTNLAALLRRLLAGLGPNRLRLNSLEPLTVTDEIIALFGDEPRLAPHLQIPLQSGSPAVLRRMRRNYRLEQYADRLDQLRRAVPGIGLGADVIVGFPGETDAEFDETYRFIQGSALSYLHVFSWSARPGTPAADYAGPVASARIRDRTRRLRELGQTKGLEFRRRWQGQPLDAVVLERREAGALRALTGNFIEVDVERSTARRGDLIGVRITGVEEERTHAVTVDRPTWSVLPTAP